MKRNKPYPVILLLASVALGACAPAVPPMQEVATVSPVAPSETPFQSAPEASPTPEQSEAQVAVPTVKSI